MELSDHIYGNVDIILDDDCNSCVESRNDHIYEDTIISQESRDWTTEEKVPFKCKGEDNYSGCANSGRRSSRAGKGFLVLLCLLLLAGIGGLGFYRNKVMNQYEAMLRNLTEKRDKLQTSYNTISKERDQLQTKYNTMTKESDQLQIRYNTMTKERDPLQIRNNTITKERDQLQTKYNTMTKESDQLQIRNNTITKERDQLQTKYNTMTKESDQLQIRNNTMTKESDQLQIRYNTMTKKRDQLQITNNILAEKCDELTNKLDRLQENFSALKQTGPKGWTMFQSSWYYLSSEVKSWNESRNDCVKRDADLVIINSQEEQIFLSSLNKRLWIGLTDKDSEGTWTWVDGTPLSTAYWMKHQPDNLNKEDCGEIYNNSKQNWKDISCATNLSWICEQKLT